MHLFVPAPTVGAVCTSLAGLGHDPAVSVSAVLLGASLLAQASIRIALRTRANDVVEREKTGR